MRTVFPVLLAAVLLVAATPALADAPGRGNGSAGHGRGVAVGAFATASANVTGDNVAFSYDASGIHGFRVHDVDLFDAVVSAQASNRRASASTEGAQIRVDEPAYTFVAHDNPAAVARLVADGSATLTFSSAVTLTQQGPHRAVFTLGNLTGAVRAEDLTVNGRVARAHDDILVLLDEPAGDFDRHRTDITAAIGESHVGAEASFHKEGSDVQQDLVSYGNVTMTTLRAAQGNLTLLIQGNGTDGRVLVLNVDNGVLGAQRAEDLHILLDNASVSPADSLADILDPDNDGFTPEYYVVYDPGASAFQLLVSVPHYSMHTLSLTTDIILPPPSVVLGIALGALVLVPTAFLLFRRPKA